MPNWCQNVVRINHANHELIVDLKAKLDEDDQKFFEHLFPNPAGEWNYEWSCNNWGTKWDASVREYNINNEGALYASFDTAWSPPIEFYEFLESEGYTVDAFYNEEGMAFCGTYSDGFHEQYEYVDLSASDIEDQLPTELDEMFYISGMQRDREDEYEEEEDKTKISISGYFLEEDRTDWYKAKINPVRDGFYEVQTEGWPFPQLAHWIEGEWFTENFETGEFDVGLNKITKWRGLNFDPAARQAEMLKALEELKIEFDNLSAGKLDCVACGAWHTQDELVEVEGQYTCPSCGEGWVLEEGRE
jgi:hypothetical protein